MALIKTYFCCRRLAPFLHMSEVNSHYLYLLTASIMLEVTIFSFIFHRRIKVVLKLSVLQMGYFFI
jgi:hypothetical protein